MQENRLTNPIIRTAVMASAYFPVDTHMVSGPASTSR